MESGPTRTVAMRESVRSQTQRSQSVARSLRGHTVIEGVPWSFQTESEVPDDHLLERVRDYFGHACRRRLQVRTTRKDDGGVRISRGDVGVLRVIDEESMWVKELDKYESSVSTIRPSTSPRLEKQTETTIPVNNLSFTDPQCAHSST